MGICLNVGLCVDINTDINTDVEIDLEIEPYRYGFKWRKIMI